jgi:hypothetical protein
MKRNGNRHGSLRLHAPYGYLTPHPQPTSSACDQPRKITRGVRTERHTQLFVTCRHENQQQGLEDMSREQRLEIQERLLNVDGRLRVLVEIVKELHAERSSLMAELAELCTVGSKEG